MSMLRKRDRVRLPTTGIVVFVRRLEGAFAWLSIDDSKNEHQAPVDALTLLCGAHGPGGQPCCEEPACSFAKLDGQPVCEGHAGEYAEGFLVDVRPDASILCPCACGEDLAAGTSRGIWTMEGVACEYRDCAHCGSSRAFMAADTVEGVPVTLACGSGCIRWWSLLDALESYPTEGAELRRAGATLARAVDGAKRGSRVWLVLPPTRETR